MTFPSSSWAAMPELLTIKDAAKLIHGSGEEKYKKRIRKALSTNNFPKPVDQGTRTLYFKKKDLYSFLYGGDYETNNSLAQNYLVSLRDHK
tara:strand:+ start:5759 stop:6031 length:273 start_codon:yes stop_codon:yes gene_type:complete